MNQTIFVTFVWRFANLLRDSFRRHWGRASDASIRVDREDSCVTGAALKTIAAVLNTYGARLPLRMVSGGSLVGIEDRKLGHDDKSTSWLTSSRETVWDVPERGGPEVSGFFARGEPGTVKLLPERVGEYAETRYGSTADG